LWITQEDSNLKLSIELVRESEWSIEWALKETIPELDLSKERYFLCVKDLRDWFNIDEYALSIVAEFSDKPMKGAYYGEITVKDRRADIIQVGEEETEIYEAFSIFVTEKLGGKGYMRILV